MSFKCNIITGFVIYWAYQLYRYRKTLASPFDKFRFPDF